MLRCVTCATRRLSGEETRRADRRGDTRFVRREARAAGFVRHAPPPSRQGWTPRNATNRDGESESAWTLDPEANDPGIVSGPLGPTDGTGLDPARFNAIHLSIRSCAPGKVAQLFYRTVADPTWDEAKSVKLAIENDCSFHEITFDMRGEAAWRDGGGVIQLRLDPTGEGRADGADEIAIDWAQAIQR